MTPSPPRSRKGSLARGSLWAAVLALSLALALFYGFGPRPTDRRPAAPPDVSDPEETIAAFTGELPAADGGWLIATLAPLHFDARRQAFERQALELELGLPKGEPWRLSLRWEPPRPETSRSKSGDSQDAGELPRLALQGFAVEDEHGTALEPLPETQGGETRARDPLRTLLSAPAGSLGPGETLDWILWGRAPGLGASLSGLPQGLVPAAGPFRGPLELRATRLRRADLGQPLARLDREPAGKNPTGKTSGSRDGVEGR